ncbi:MAG: nicotinate-nucleotide adenylyltransferase [Casimicrobiaceae bacterium]
MIDAAKAADSASRELPTRPLGILGGTFDPIHCGHLELAREARAALDLAEVLVIPAGDPPHRQAPIASARDRLAMVGLAVAGLDGVAVDRREVDREGRSYTVLTLSELRSERPFQPLLLIVGADALLGLEGWHRWREVFVRAHLVVVARPGTDLVGSLTGALADEWQARHTTDRRDLEKVDGGSIYQQAITPHAISASAIRAALARGDTAAVRGLLPAAVLAYIGRNHLYEPRPDAT